MTAEQPSVEALEQARERANDSWAGQPYPVGPGVSQEFARAVQDRRVLAAALKETKALLTDCADDLERAERERDEAQATVDEVSVDAAEWMARAQKAEAERQWLLDREKHHESKAETVVEAARGILSLFYIDSNGTYERYPTVETLRAALTAYDEPPTEA